MSERTDIKKFSQFNTVTEGPIEVVGLKGGQNVKAWLTTDLVSTNPDVTFRDAKGKFRSTKDLEDLTDQLKVNRFIANELDALNEAIENIDFPEGADLSGFATKADVTEAENASIFRDETIKSDLEDRDQKQTAAILVVEKDVQEEAKNRRINDDKLQEQIDALAAGDVDLSPVEDRLDDIEAVLPKAPIVIPPVEIGSGKVLIDHPTRPSGADKPPEGECWMWHMDADRTGNPANEMKTTVSSEYQANVIIDGINTVWFKQGDRVQKWNTANGGWWTGGNLWHLSASSTEGDTLVDGQPFEIYYVDPNAESDDLIDAISRLESKADDRRLQAEIEVLSGQLSTLVKSQEDGEWEYKGELPEVPRQPGQFILATSTLTSELNSVYVQETDLNGITHNFTAPVGSYIEIVDIDDPLDYVLFEVTDGPQGSGLIQIDCKMIKAGNSFDLNDRCIIRFFEVSDGLDINELDRRYLQLAGGTMKGSIKFLNGANLSFVDEEGQGWTQFKLGKTTEYVGQYGGDNAIATKKRIAEAVEGLASEEWVTEQIEGIELPDVDDTSDTRGRVYLGTYTLKTSSGQPSGDVTNDELTLWHINPSDAATNPANEFKCRVGYGGASLTTQKLLDIVNGAYEHSGDVIWHFVQGDNAIRMVGEGAGWTSPSTVYHSSGTSYSGDVLTANQPVDLFVEVDVNFLVRNFENYARLDRHNKYSDRQSVYCENDADVAFSISRGTPTASNARLNIYTNGTIETWQTEFDSDKHLVTKKYVDDKVKAGGGGFTPGDQVAKIGSSSNNTGAFWIVDGALYCKV